MKAKVFLSCGQNSAYKEPAVARKIQDAVDALGFHCYVAVEHQTLEGLRENIFRQLHTSEYLLFVDFLRERLPDAAKSRDAHRGSLFTNQELAVASYLGLPVVLLQEAGVRPLDGMLSCFQGNIVHFDDRNKLPDVITNIIRDKLDSGEWSTSCRNAFSVEASDRRPIDACVRAEQLAPCRFFHLAVRNNHQTKTAENCCVILESAMRERTKERIPVETIEFKWAGTHSPNVLIAPSTSRKFDAFRVMHSDPTSVHFSVLSDSTAYIPQFKGEGPYLVTYGIYSSNFRRLRVCARLVNAPRLDGARVEIVSQTDD